jgi:hypothetical protein
LLVSTLTTIEYCEIKTKVIRRQKMSILNFKSILNCLQIKCTSQMQNVDGVSELELISLFIYHGAKDRRRHLHHQYGRQSLYAEPELGLGAKARDHELHHRPQHWNSTGPFRLLSK